MVMNDINALERRDARGGLGPGFSDLKRPNRFRNRFRNIPRVLGRRVGIITRAEHVDHVGAFCESMIDLRRVRVALSTDLCRLRPS
jgi:hypothetical protein